MDDAVLDLTGRLSGLSLRLTADIKLHISFVLMEAGGGSSESPGYNFKFPE
jgi:hypothetical protein